MKNLYLIGGTMGVGKTTACQELKKLLDHSVFLDGDWCWDMHPFTVTPETKAMVLDNICYLLSNFLRCSACENVIFCWVMHEQSILEELLSRLDLANCRVVPVSLVCSREALERRLQADISRGVRTADILDRSAARLELYQAMDTIKLDTTELTPLQTARILAQMGK